MIHEVATTHRPHVLRARVAFKMATNNSGKRKTKEKSGYEKRMEKRQHDLKESSTAQEQTSLRSRRYSRAQGGKLEIPPAQKLSILSSAHRAHGSAHTNVFALENQSERELLIMILAGLQCSKRCQLNNCFVFFCHGEQSNSHETFAKAYTVNIMLFPNPVGKIAITSLPSNKCWIDILCSHFKTMGRPIADK